jgi:hypothetical protein
MWTQMASKLWNTFQALFSYNSIAEITRDHQLDNRPFMVDTLYELSKDEVQKAMGKGN